MIVKWAGEVRAALARAGGELALIDVREHGQFGEGHPFLAVNLPYSRLEIEAPKLLPCRLAPVVLIDDGDGVADKAARRLEALGHAQVAVLEGGAPAWAAAGFTLFKGVNVPSKAFGELVEQARHTPALDPGELKQRLDRGEPLVLVDARPPGEHGAMTIPRAIGCPGAELAHRWPALVPDASTPIVVHCAGRTRSIIGAETLRALGLPNPVYALRNGTQGWRLAGLELEHGSERLYPALSAAQRAPSREQARALRDRHDIPAVPAATLADWRRDDGRTLYLLDVRTEEEYREGHLPGARHAPGGQLVQATDLWIAVRGARVVLCDDTGLRAGVAAYWLRQMGHEAVVLDGDVTQAAAQEQGRESDTAIPATLPRLEIGELRSAIEGGAQLLDLRPAMAYRAGHIAGARWSIRPRLDRLGLDPARPVVMLGTDARLAELAAVDLRERGGREIACSPGGPADWRAAGLEVVETPDVPPDAECIDYLFFVHDRHAGNLDAARRYLEWETNLVRQMDDADRAAFRLTP